MKVSKSWLKELVDLKVPVEEIIKLLPLRTIGIKEETPEYFELDMKGYNRADLLSMRGVAYEIAAITNSPVFFSENENFSWQNLNLPNANVKVGNPILTPLYCIAKIENLKVEHSNETWVKKLNDSGVRAVNNVADITNLIMMEYGQPMHAFDAQKVKDETIIVRTAKEDEEITTLDGKKRKLEKTDLLITDPQKAIGIAGVMGGQNSEITSSTTSILLEAAIFDPVNLRKTATRLGLQSEASKRFQHGLTKKRCLQAFDAAIKLYQELGGKLTGITLIGNLKDETKTIQLIQTKINSLIGIDITPAEVESSLTKLGFKLASHSSSGNVFWEVIPPYWRLDIEIEDDLIEEIARMYGYEKIPAKQLAGNIPEIIQNPVSGLIESLKETLSQAGLTEVQTYSFYSTQVMNNLNLNKDKLIKILNSMSAETEYLRDNLWPNLVEATAKNLRQGYKDIAIFEIGKVYWLENSQPKEGYRLSIALSNGTDNPIQELSAITNSLSSVIARSPLITLRTKKQSSTSISNPTMGDSSLASLSRRSHIKDGRSGQIARNDIVALFHPTRFADLEKDGKSVGWIAEIHPRFVNKFGIEQRIAVLEITVPQ